jgi:hypothetical protein
MTTNWQSWLFWPDKPALSLLVLVLILLPFMYASRHPVHGLIHSVSRAAASGLRLAARWLRAGAEELQSRNKTVLLAHAEEEASSRLEREFELASDIVRRDLQDFPAVGRKLKDAVTQIEEDFRLCGEVPPPPPEWVEAVESVSQMKSAGSEMLQGILEEIHKSVQKMHDKMATEFRRAYENRHKLLRSMLPHWRAAEKLVGEAETKLLTLQKNAASIDAQMLQYREITRRTDKAAKSQTHSSFVRFFVSGLVMLIALGGAFINFKLIALPMSEMVGAADYVTASLRTSEVAALVLIFVEASMGLFLLEALRITHLFPRISSMDDRMRRRMIWISLTLLVVLATIESSLALMRDLLIADKQALIRDLASSSVQAAQANDKLLTAIPTAGQMILGFVLPFALAFVAIPLEAFVNSARTVVGAALVLALRTLALLARVLATACRQAGRGLAMLYDIPISPFLLAEKAIRGTRTNGASAAPAAPAAAPPGS